MGFRGSPNGIRTRAPTLRGWLERSSPFCQISCRTVEQDLCYRFVQLVSARIDPYLPICRRKIGKWSGETTPSGTPHPPGWRHDSTLSIGHSKPPVEALPSSFYADVVAGVGGGDEGARALLSTLMERVGDNRMISDLLAPNVDVDGIEVGLRPVCTGDVSIDSIAGNESRIDAVVTSDLGVARIVFARNEDGLVTWLHTYLKPAPFSGIDGGLVIVVNGPSGVGKSTLMRSLQSVARFPLVVLDEPEQIGVVQPGYLIWRDSAPALHRGYLAAIAALAGAGNHVTLSAAGHTYDEIIEAFSDVLIVSVGMRCDFDVLVDREQRTGRWAGIAAQSLGVHDGWAYDLEIDTTNGPDPLELARRVLMRVAP